MTKYLKYRVNFDELEFTKEDDNLVITCKKVKRVDNVYSLHMIIKSDTIKELYEWIFQN